MVADAVDKQGVAQGNIEAQNGITSFDTCAQIERVARATLSAHKFRFAPRETVEQGALHVKIGRNPYGMRHTVHQYGVFGQYRR